MTIIPEAIDISVRVYSKPKKKPKRRKTGRRKRKLKKWDRRFLIFDTETTKDSSQQLLFGVYRFCRFTSEGELRCLDEKIFYADSLPVDRPDEFHVVQDYCRGRMADTHARMRLRAISREDFVRQMIGTLRAHGVIVAFNLPFDLSRVAAGWGRTRNWHPRAFSLWFGHKNGTEDRHLPRICMSLIDSKRAFYKIRSSMTPGESAWRGALLDLRTLAFALSGESHSLRSAGERFEGAFLKTDAPELGRVTAEAIDYCRADVRATASLLVALRKEFDRHPIDLMPWRAYSPASIGKAYLRKAGVQV